MIDFCNRHFVLLGQGSVFLIVGGLQFCVDAGLFITLTWLGLVPSIANVASRLLAACLGFVLNGRLTFRDGADSRLGWSRFGRFAVCWAVLTVISTVSVVATTEFGGLGLSWIAKPLIEIVLALVSFFAMRKWVYV